MRCLAAMLFMFVVVVVVLVNERTPDASASWADCERLSQLWLSLSPVLAGYWDSAGGSDVVPVQDNEAVELVWCCEVQEAAGRGGGGGCLVFLS